MEVSGKTVLGVTYWQVLGSRVSCLILLSVPECIVETVYSQGSESQWSYPIICYSEGILTIPFAHHRPDCLPTIFSQAFSTSGLMSALLFETAIIAIQVLR